MRNPVRYIRWISDWLEDRQATAAERRLRQQYEPLIDEAAKKKEWEERDRLLSEWSFERDSVLHPVYARNAERLVAQAIKYGIRVEDQPSSFSHDSEVWVSEHGVRILDDEA